MEKKENHKPKKSKSYPLTERELWNARNNNDIMSDVLGSYTGTGEDDEYPVQDVDDL